MGNFLLFNETGRLIATRELALAPGAVPAEAVFPGSHGTCVELHPAVLLKVRPPVWNALVGHAARHAEGVRIDDLPTIRVHLEQREIRKAERDLVEAASRLAVRDQAGRLLADGLPPSEREAQERARGELRNAEGRIACMRRGDFEPPIVVPPVLAQLAGRVLPL